MANIVQTDLCRSTVACTPSDRDVVLAHDVPGRMRFGILSLKRSDSAGQLVGARVSALEGVASARVNPLTGSLIVVYDGASRTRTRIFAALTQLNYRIGSRPAVHASARPRNTAFAGAVAKVLVRKLLEDVCYVVVAAII
jgi:hypothetical protein